MNKARIILSVVALFAVIGGAFAFKAMRTGTPVWTTTTAYSTFGTIYTVSTTSPICTSTTSLFITQPPVGVNSVVLNTTAQAAGITTLTRQNGSQTITLPNYCTVATTTLTRVTPAE